MDDTTPSTSQNNMGEPPTTLQPTTESPSVLTGPTNVDTTSSGTFNSPHFFDKFHYLSNKLSQLCYCIVVGQMLGTGASLNSGEVGVTLAEEHIATGPEISNIPLSPEVQSRLPSRSDLE